MGTSNELLGDVAGLGTTVSNKALILSLKHVSCFHLGFCFVSLFPLQVWVCAHECRRKPDPVELELQVVVSHLTWVPGTEL